MKFSCFLKKNKILKILNFHIIFLKKTLPLRNFINKLFLKILFIENILFVLYILIVIKYFNKIFNTFKI